MKRILGKTGYIIGLLLGMGMLWWSIGTGTVCAAEIAVNEENFPDEVFRNYISENFDTDGNACLSEREIDYASVIEINETELSSLEGIQYFKNLSVIKISCNKVKELDVSELSQLYYLKCDNNEIEKLNLGDGNRLKYLLCSNNNISELDLEKKENLLYLYCADNSLTDLNLNCGGSLVSLYCSGNQISELNLEGYSKLEYLNFQLGYVDKLNVKGCTGLEELYCSYNALTSLDVSDCTNLQKVKCFGNCLTYLDVSACEGLTELEFGSNNLYAVKVNENSVFENITDIKFVQCNYIVKANQVALADMPGFDINCIVDGTLSNAVIEGEVLKPVDIFNSVTYQYDIGNGLLYTFIISFNEPLEDIVIDESTFPDEVFRQIVKSYDANGDDILSEDEYRHVSQFILPGEGIKSLEGINKFVSLNDLYCPGNELEELDVSGLANLQSIYCPQNVLKSINVEGCSKLESLSCANNQLETLDLSDCSKLVSLYCPYNKLVSIDLTNCTDLESLDCYNNNLQELDISNNKKLIQLQCNDNELQALDLRNNELLEFLYCGSNSYTELDLSNNVNLLYFYCYFVSNLEEIDFSKSEKLIVAHCSWCDSLKKIDVTQCPLLEELICHDDDELSYIDVSNNKALRSVNFSGSGFYCLNLDNAENLEAWGANDNRYVAGQAMLNLEELEGFDLSRVVDKEFTNGILQGNYLLSADSSDTVTYEYDIGRGNTVTFTIVLSQSVADKFIDVDRKQWFLGAVQYVYDKGIMSGKSKWEFNPNGNLTRAEFATVLYNMESKPDIGYDAIFKDVPAGQWYSAPVLWVYTNGIANGYPNGNYGVSDKITREQLALMLYKYAKLKGYDMTCQTGTLDKFVDKDAVSSWAVEALQWAVSQGIMSGKGNASDPDNYRLDPAGNATRAECASMMMKLLEKN